MAWDLLLLGVHGGRCRHSALACLLQRRHGGHAGDVHLESRNLNPFVSVLSDVDDGVLGLFTGGRAAAR